MAATQPVVVSGGSTPPAQIRSNTRVLAVIDWLEVGGAQQHLLTLATSLAPHHCHFEVATSGDEPLAAAYEAVGIRVHRLARRSIKHKVSPVFTARLTGLAASGAYDLIHSHLHSASLAAAVAARVTRVPLVITHHSMNTWRSPWDTMLGRWADRQADAVIAVAHNVAASVERGGVQPRIIPNGVSLAIPPRPAAVVVQERAALGAPPDAYVVGFVGRFSPDKNPLLFVEIAALVARRCPTAHFLMIGDGPLRAATEARVRALGLQDRLSFAGFLPSAAEFLPLLDVLVLTSDSEASPLVILEAMAAARPVVATAVGDVAHQIVEGETGYIRAPRDAIGLAQSVVELADAEPRQRLGEAGKARVTRYFSVARTLAHTAEVYGEVLERRSVSRRQPEPQEVRVLAK
jgi:glycosyltransferase involved in cell wall biosynthesis